MFTNFEIMPSSSKSKVCFFFDGIKVPINNRTRLKKFIEDIFRAEKRKLIGLNYIFCTDKKLLEINRQFLKHDYYTDIITFDLSENSAIIGEIYISVERIKHNSRILKEYFSNELLRVIFHGALHLCNYKDKTTSQIKIMRAKETFYLEKYKK